MRSGLSCFSLIPGISDKQFVFTLKKVSYNNPTKRYLRKMGKVCGSDENVQIMLQSVVGVYFSWDFPRFSWSLVSGVGSRLSASCVRSARAGTAAIPISLVISAHNRSPSKNSRPNGGNENPSRLNCTRGNDLTFVFKCTYLNYNLLGYTYLQYENLYLWRMIYFFGFIISLLRSAKINAHNEWFWVIDYQTIVLCSRHLRLPTALIFISFKLHGLKLIGLFFRRGHATVNERENGAIVFGRTATKYGCFRDTPPVGSKYLTEKKNSFIAVMVKF